MKLSPHVAEGMDGSQEALNTLIAMMDERGGLVDTGKTLGEVIKLLAHQHLALSYVVKALREENQ